MLLPCMMGYLPQGKELFVICLPIIELIIILDCINDKFQNRKMKLITILMQQDYRNAIKHGNTLSMTTLTH